MSPRPQAYRAKDGTITWHVRFRIDGAPNPVKETFGPFDFTMEAEQTDAAAADSAAAAPASADAAPAPAAAAAV